MVLLLTVPYFMAPLTSQKKTQVSSWYNKSVLEEYQSKTTPTGKAFGKVFMKALIAWTTVIALTTPTLYTIGLVKHQDYYVLPWTSLTSIVSWQQWGQIATTLNVIQYIYTVWWAQILSPIAEHQDLSPWSSACSSRLSWPLLPTSQL